MLKIRYVPHNIVQTLGALFSACHHQTEQHPSLPACHCNHYIKHGLPQHTSVPAELCNILYIPLQPLTTTTLHYCTLGISAVWLQPHSATVTLCTALRVLQQPKVSGHTLIPRIPSTLSPLHTLTPSHSYYHCQALSASLPNADCGMLPT